MPRKFIERFKRIDYYIYKRRTGTPKQLADRLEISRSTLLEFIAVMKENGAPIKWDKIKKTYYYSHQGRFNICFAKENESPI
ncbi:MAG: hypothetical protein ACK4E8_12435 [Lacibacter sp.]|jgi:predicted DNA-binding transcriptional regulator YafY